MSSTQPTDIPNVIEVIIVGLFEVLGRVWGLGLLVASLFACVAFLLGLLLDYSGLVVVIAFVVGYALGMFWASRTKTPPVSVYQ